jgi:hypothetical protein
MATGWIDQQVLTVRFDDVLERFARGTRILFLLTLLCSGCPSSTNAPADTCTKVGQTCKLAPGVLGVCVEQMQGTCVQPNCLACVSQH